MADVPSHMSELQNYSESANVAEHGGTISPFQGIMADILADIFLWAVQMDKGSVVTSHNCKRWAPINVMAVCRHWAAVALSCPSLWSAFRGTNMISTTSTIDFPWNHLETFLRRSQQMPFSLSIHIDYGTPMYYEKLLDVLLRNATRFKTLDIDWSSEEEMPVENEWMINLQMFSSLEDLRLRVICFGVSVTIDLSDAPRLKRLELDGDFTLTYDRQLRCPSLVSADLSRMMSISVIETPNSVPRRFSCLDCVLIMQASPSLTTFSPPTMVIDWQDTACPGYLIEEPCAIHYKLTSLNLHLEYRDAARHLFEHLNLPNLTDITLERPAGSWSSEFGEMISRSKATINKFVVRVGTYKLPEITRCLQHMPALQTLSVQAESFEYAELRNFILHLTTKPESQLCPELEHIEFRFCGDPSFCSEELTAMIFSRWDRSVVGDRRCLKSVKFEDHNIRRDLPYSIPSQFLQFRREGLVIEGLAENNSWN